MLLQTPGGSLSRHPRRYEMASAYRTERTVRASTRSPVRPSMAAAYCGAAHGLTWQLAQEDGATPAEIVELAVKDGTAWYRLVRHPSTGAPALDRRHRFIYVPAQAFRSRRQPHSVTDGRARVTRYISAAATSGRAGSVSGLPAG